MGKTPKLRVALLGAGRISRFHLQALQKVPGVSIAAICDVDRSRADAVAAQWNVPAVYSNLSECLTASSPDVVHVLVPPDVHAPAVMDCLRAGAHVLVEKPLATSVRDCANIDVLRRGKSLTVGVNHTQLYHPTFLRLCREVTLGHFGAIHHISGHHLCASPLTQCDWAHGSVRRMVFELAPHPLSQLIGLLGRVQQVAALEPHVREGPTGECTLVSCSLAFANATAECTFGFGSNCTQSSLHVIGEDAVAWIDATRNLCQIVRKSRHKDPLGRVDELWRNVLRTAAATATGSLRHSLSVLAPRRFPDPFTSSMNTSIEAFYNILRSNARVHNGFDIAAEVVAACQYISDQTESNSPRRSIA